MNDATTLHDVDDVGFEHSSRGRLAHSRSSRAFMIADVLTLPTSVVPTNIHAARNIISDVRAGRRRAKVAGVGSLSGPTLITPRQAGVSVGVTWGPNAVNMRIGVMIVAPTAQTQPFLNQMAQLAGNRQEIDVQTVGPMVSDAPTATAGNYYQQARRPLEPGLSVGNIRKRSAGTLGESRQR
jgi:hypothetical protein